MHIIHTELKTIRDFIRFATSNFNKANLYYGHGTTNSWDEAFALILHTLYLPHNVSEEILSANLTKSECEELFTVIHKRISKHLPVPYITHQAWFCGLPFYVDERVLIPRSPIAELIEKQFQPWVKVDNIHHILDLCTGSGCIAIACGLVFPEAKVDASDIAFEALEVAKINIEEHHVEDQVTLYQSDLFKELPVKKYDIIVSNPPYVSDEEMTELPNEYQHEPAAALQAGEQGLDIIIEILKQASQYLTSHGILIVEVGNSYHALCEQYPDIPFTWLEFERSDAEVFLLTAEQLRKVVI